MENNNQAQRDERLALGISQILEGKVSPRPEWTRFSTEEGNVAEQLGGIALSEPAEEQ